MSSSIWPRCVSESGSRSVHRGAAAFLERVRGQDNISDGLISPAELNALVSMALAPIPYNGSVIDEQQSMRQREANEKAFACAVELLKITDRPHVMSSGVCDMAALEILRASWFVSPGEIT